MEPDTLFIFPSSGLSTRISLHVKLGSETQLHQQCLETWRESDHLVFDLLPKAQIRSHRITSSG